MNTELSMYPNPGKEVLLKKGFWRKCFLSVINLIICVDNYSDDDSVLKLIAQPKLQMFPINTKN